MITRPSALELLSFKHPDIPHDVPDDVKTDLFLITKIIIDSEYFVLFLTILEHGQMTGCSKRNFKFVFCHFSAPLKFGSLQKMLGPEISIINFKILFFANLGSNLLALPHKGFVS